MISDAHAQQLWEVALAIGGNVLAGLALVTVGWFASKWARRAVATAATRAELHQSLVRFLSTAAHYAVLVVAAAAALERVGVQTASMVAALASAGVAVGLALQGSLSNLASGVMLVAFRPFDLHDEVRVAGETGRVVDIGLFATRLVTIDGVKITVPNAAITSTTIANFTGLGRRAAVATVQLARSADPDTARQALLAAGRAIPGALADPPVTVAIAAIGAHHYELELRVWAEARHFTEVLEQARAACVALGRDLPGPEAPAVRA